MGLPIRKHWASYTLCAECAYATIYGDMSHVNDDSRVARIQRGIAQLGQVSWDDGDIRSLHEQEFWCECCKEMAFGRPEIFVRFLK